MKVWVVVPLMESGEPIAAFASDDEARDFVGLASKTGAQSFEIHEIPLYSFGEDDLVLMAKDRAFRLANMMTDQARRAVDED